MPAMDRLVNLEAFSSVEAKQVVETVPPGSGGGFDQVTINQVLQQSLGLLGHDTGEGCSHAGGEVGAGDKAEASEHTGGGWVQFFIGESKTGSHLDIAGGKLP